MLPQPADIINWSRWKASGFCADVLASIPNYRGLANAPCSVTLETLFVDRSNRQGHFYHSKAASSLPIDDVHGSRAKSNWHVDRRPINVAQTLEGGVCSRR